MKFLKGFGAFILGFLFFISLSIFSVVFLVNSTILNSSFINRQIDRIDISALARDFTEQQIQENLPNEINFLQDAIYNVVDAQEPALKKLLNQAINSGYDYFLGKTDKFKITVSLEAIKKDLKDSLWKELSNQLPAWLGDNIQTELKPYIEQNLTAYRATLPPELAGLNDAQLKAYLDTYLKQIQDQIKTTGKSPELTGLLETLLKPYFDEYYNEFIGRIPSELTADESSIPAETMSQLVKIKTYIGYFRTAYYALIGLMVLLAAGIFLIYRNVQEPSRTLGIDIFIFGAVDLISVYILKSINLVDFLMSSIRETMPSMETWINALSSDITRIMMTFSIVVLVVGVILIVISFIFKKKTAEE